MRPREIPERLVIPSVRELRDLNRALESPSPFLLLTNTHIGNLEALVGRLARADKLALVHADMIGGFRSDTEGMKLLKNMFKVYGVISQNQQVTSTAKKAGLWAIQRILLVDSRSLDQAHRIIEQTKPDGVELLPGSVAARFYSALYDPQSAPTMIAGGMVDTREEAAHLFNTGFQAITTSSQDLWAFDFTKF